MTALRRALLALLWLEMVAALVGGALWLGGRP